MMMRRSILFAIPLALMASCASEDAQETGTQKQDGEREMERLEDTSSVSMEALPEAKEYEGVVTMVDGNDSGASAVLTDRLEEESFDNKLLKFPEESAKSMDKYYGEHVKAVCTPSPEGKDSLANCKVVK